MSAHLLAVDLGLRTGLAVYAGDGRLVRYRSQHFGTVAQLKRAVWGELAAIEGLATVAVEGDAALARVWGSAARKRGAALISVDAQTWREALLIARDRRRGADAKAAADGLAREVIAASGLPRPTALRHDAAEAICVGLWACRAVGWPEIL
ncbi:MAG: hypothetical protein KF729_37305 [Sandaracinaceae bacterium]|nr:hypothetical protein [Sandaracinaceae bacterium]